MERLGPDALLVIAVVGFAGALIAELPGDFNIDSWLALVTGREVWQSGIPHHETLIAMGHGHQWVDQQWLSQLVSYGLYLVGGLALLGLVNVALLIASVAGAVVAARRRGAPFLSVLVALPLCAALIVPSREVRTQTLVLPLFVAVAYLLAGDARSPSRRVYWCLPLLVLWANLHGTVTLGAILVVLRGLTLLWERRSQLRSSGRAWRRPLALIAGAAVAILITPYGLGMIDYYRTTLVGGTLRQAVSEWQPATTEPALAATLLLVAGIAVWSFGRNPERTTVWERITLVLLAAAAVSAVRNAVFLGLFALMVVPVSVGLPGRNRRSTPDADARNRGRARAPQRLRLNAALLGGSLLLLLAVGAVTLTRPARAIELSYQRMGVLRAVERAVHTDPALRVMADERVDDWLLWRDPALAGRIAADARFELLSPRQVDQVLSLFGVVGADWKQAARGYRLLVLDRRYDPETVSGFLSEPGRRVLYDDGERLVILRGAVQAARS